MKQTSCQVDGCGYSLPKKTAYHTRYRICTYHATLQHMEIGGHLVRFCQQCGRFQDLSDFDGLKKSCRKKLSMHNAQRKRKRDRNRGQYERQLPTPRLLSTRSKHASVSTTNSLPMSASFNTLSTLGLTSGTGEVPLTHTVTHTAIQMGQPTSRLLTVTMLEDKPAESVEYSLPELNLEIPDFDIDALFISLNEDNPPHAQHDLWAGDQVVPFGNPIGPPVAAPLAAEAEALGLAAARNVLNQWSVALPYDPLDLLSAPLPAPAPPSASVPSEMPSGVSWRPQNLHKIGSSSSLCSTSYRLFNVHPSELPRDVHNALKSLAYTHGFEADNQW